MEDHQRSPKLKPNLAGKDSGNVQSWWEVPSIAHFCSLFRAAFNLLDFDIEDLEEALLTDGADDTGSCLLQDLIVRLLAGCLGHSPNNTDISPFNYQMFLRRFLRQKCQEQFRENPFNTDIDFQFLPLRTKVQIIHTLCDFRLDADDVQDVLKNLESDSLRVDPLGHDANSSAYYYFYGTRLYREDVPKTANKNRGKVKRRKLKQEKVKKKRGKGGKKGQEAEDEDNDESDHEATPEQGTGTWQVICYTEEDWGKLAGQLKGSTVKEEKALYRVLAEDFLPEIPRLFAEKERLQRKRMAEFMPRRQSSRIEKLAKEKEESARIMAKEEEERKIKENEERERRQRQLEEEILKERAAGRTFHGTTRLSSRSCSSRSESEEESTGSKPVGRQTNNSLSSATGKIHISSSKKKMRSSQVFKATTEDIKTGMFKVLEQLKNHEDAWPFLDEVSEDYAPRYYSVIRKPMDLNRMGDKLDDGSYTSVSLFRADFMRIIDNCRVYNGDGSEYTEMAMNLLERFEKCMERYVGSGFSSDEEVAVEFPSEERQRKKHRHRRHDRRHSHHSSQSDSSRDQSKHRSKERKKEPDKKKKVYADDEEEEDEDDDNSSHVTRNDSDWDQSRDIRFKTNHKKSQIFARITEHDKHRKLKNDDERLDNVNDDSRDGDQEWKDENLSDQSRSRDSSCSGNRHGNKRKKEDIRRLAAHKKRINDEAKDADKPEKAGEKRGAIRSERSKDGSTKNKTEPLTWEEQQRRDRAWSELVGSGDDKDEREDQKKDIFDLDLDDAGWEGLKQGLKEWKREKNQQKKPEKISDSKRMKRMSQEEEDRWFEEKETIHHDIKVVDADPFAALEREMSSNETFRRKHKERVELEQNMEDKSQKPAPPQPKKGVGVLKNPAIHHALSSATEEILKDLMWLDEVPRGSEFSSASSSPSQCLGDDQDSQKSLTNSKDEKEKDTSGKRKTPGGSTKSKEGKDTVKDGANAAPKRRTTERLQPGKSKGNLIASIQGETATTKEGRTASEWNKLTAPKLSLGTVLTSGFGVGVGLVKRHNFSDNSAESTPKDGGSSPNDAETEDDKEKAYLAAQKKALLEATLRREREEAEERERREKEEEELERQRKKLKEEEEERKKLKEEELEEEKELKPKQKPNPTPNLSAWFKAFGAPKSQPTTSAVVRRKPELSATLDITRADASPAQDSLGSDTPYRRDDLEDVPMTPGRRQRKLSTGSSVSEKSSFSQEQNDGCSPSYPAPFPSPLHRSPEAHRPMQAYPTNVESTIRVGFYQDTTYKSPDKSSSSPRDGPGPESHTYMHPHQASPHQAGTGSGSNYHQPLYPPYSPAPYTPSELHAGRAGGSSAASKHEPQPCSPSPAPSPAAAAVASPSPAHQDARSPSHLQIDLQSPHTSHPVEARSPMHAESPVDTHARSPLDSRLHIDTRSPIHAGSPMEAESPRLHIDARSPLDSHVRSPMDGHVRSPMHSQSPAEHRSPLHAGSSPLEPRLQIDSRSPMHAGSPMDSRSPLHTGSPMDSRSPLHGGSPMHVGSPMDSRSPLHAGSSPHESRLHIDTRSPLHSGSPMDSRSPIESRSPMHVDSRSPMDQRLQIDTRSPSHSGSPSHAMGSPTGHPHPMATAHGSPKESQSYAHHYHQQSQQALAQQAHAQHAQQAHAQHAQHAQQAHAQHAQQAHAQHAQHAQQAHAQHAQQARAYPQQYQDPYLTSRGVAAAQPGPYRPTPHASPAPVYPHQLHHKHLLQQTLIKQQQEKEQQLFQQQQLQQEKEQQIIMQKLQQEKEQQIIMQKLQQEKEQQLMMQKLQQEKEQQLMMQKLQQEKEQQIMMQKLQQEKEQQLMMQKIQQEKQNQMLQLQQMQKLQQEKQNQETQQQMYMQRQHEQQIHQQLLAQQHQQYQSQQYAAQHQPQQSQQQLLAQQQQRSRTPVSSFPVKKRHYAEASFASTVSNFPAPSSVTPATTSTVSSTPTTSVSGSASSVPPSGLPLSRSPFTSGVPVGVPVGGARSPFTPVSEVAPRSGRSPFTPVTSAGAGVGAGPGSAALHQHLSHMMDVYPRPYYPPNPGAGALPGSLGSPLFGRPSSVHGSAFKESQPSSAPAAPPAAPVYPTKGQVAAAAAAAAAAHSPPVPVVTTPKQEAKNRQKAAKASEAAAAAAAAAAEASSAPAAAGAGGTAFQHYGLKGHPAAPGQAQVDVSKVPAVLPGSAFNFGPTSGLGLYPDKDSYSAYPGAAAAAAAAAGYYGHRPPAAADGADVTVPTAASFPFLSHQPHQAHQAQRAHQAAASAYPPVHGLAQALMDPAAYQQYLLHQGLYPGSYHHPAALGLRPPYDSMQRPPWL